MKTKHNLQNDYLNDSDIRRVRSEILRVAKNVTSKETLVALASPENKKGILFS